MKLSDSLDMTSTLLTPRLLSLLDSAIQSETAPPRAFSAHECIAVENSCGHDQRRDPLQIPATSNLYIEPFWSTGS